MNTSTLAEHFKSLQLSIKTLDTVTIQFGINGLAWSVLRSKLLRFRQPNIVNTLWNDLAYCGKRTSVNTKVMFVVHSCDVDVTFEHGFFGRLLKKPLEGLGDGKR